MHGELGILDDMRHDVVKKSEVSESNPKEERVFSSFVFGASGERKSGGEEKKGGRRLVGL